MQVQLSIGFAFMLKKKNQTLSLVGTSIRPQSPGFFRKKKEKKRDEEGEEEGGDG